jgi:cyclopropane fatty-acyl-phospholipid synthase-like methyltransferase
MKMFSTIQLFILKKFGKWRIKSYVGTDETSGQIQLELLKKEGCQPISKVLEIGCGALHLGIPLINYLEKGNYVGVDPNEWLREKTIKNQKLTDLINQKQVTFLSVTDFDASKLNKKFDFIFGHSVLSHCAYWQLEQFLQNTSKVLSSRGKIVASIRLAEGNKFGSPGSVGKKDSMDNEWQYPGVSWFKFSTVAQMAEKYGLMVKYHPEYTEYYTKTKPREVHDWLVFNKNLITKEESSET